MRCHHCGKDIPDGKLYCPYCGTSFSMDDESDSVHDNIKSFVGGFLKDIRNGTVLRNIRTMHYNIPAVIGGILCIVSLFLPCVVGSANGNNFSFSVLMTQETTYIIGVFISSLAACLASFSRKKKFGTVMSLGMVMCAMALCFVVHDIVTRTPPGITAEAGACMYVMLFGAWLTLLAFLFDLVVRKRIELYKTFRSLMGYKEKVDAFGGKHEEAIQSLLVRDESFAQDYDVLCEKLTSDNQSDASTGLDLIGEFMFAHEEAFPEKDRAMIREYASCCISIDENYRLLCKLNPKRKRISSVELKHKLVKGGKALVKQQFSVVTDAYDVIIKPTVSEVRTGELRRYLTKHRLLCISIACNILSIISVFLPYLSFVANEQSLTFTGFQLDTNYSVYITSFSFVALCMTVTRHRVASIVLDVLGAWAGWEMFIRTYVLLKMQYGDYVHYRFGLVLLLISCTAGLITVIFVTKIINKEYRKAKKAYKAAHKELKKMGELPVEIMDDYFCGDNCPEEIAAECTTKLDAIDNAKQKGDKVKAILAMKDLMLFAQKNINLFPEDQQSTLTSYIHYYIIACDAGIKMIKSEEG